MSPAFRESMATAPTASSPTEPPVFALQRDLNRAVQQQLSGDFVAAESILQRVLGEAPESSEAWQLFGVLALQTGKFDQAIERLEKANELNPKSADARFNLAGAYFSRQQWPQSAEAYHQAIQLNPRLAEAWKGLGACERRLNRPTAAIAAWQQSLELDPTQWQVLFDLAEALESSGDQSAAIESLQLARRLEPSQLEIHTCLARLYSAKNDLKNAACAHYNAGVIHQRQGQHPSAITAFQQALHCQPQHPNAIYLLQCLTGKTPPTAPASYVVELFDQYADHFDEHLALLKYQIPTQLRTVLDRLTFRGGTILDLGCGTGLCGREFHDRASRLVGVDVASKMIVVAQRRNIYAELHHADLHDYLNRCSDRFDVILAGDLTIYVGVARVSKPGAVFGFSVEWEETEKGYQLRASGRFAHSLRYLETLAIRHRFNWGGCESVTVREENQKPIPGKIVVLRRPG